MKCKLIVLAMLPALGLALAGCANIPGTSGAAYAPEQARQVEQVYEGTVVDVHAVQIQGNQAGIGTLAGAGLGAVAGSEFGNGRGQIITGLLGALAGGVAGNAAQQRLENTRGLQITVRLDDGRTIAVTQAADQIFRVGERVEVLQGGGVTRGSPL